MDFLDAATVLQVSALFNLMAALAWLTLAQLFRIAPQAARLMAASHLLRLLAQDGGAGLADWPALVQQGAPAFGQLACMLLLLMALRRMLPSRERTPDLAVLGGMGALGIALGLASGAGHVPELVATISAALLSMLAVRDMVRDIDGQLTRGWVVCMCLPFVLLTVMFAAHTAEMLVVPDWEAPFTGSRLPTPGRAVMVFALTVGVTLTLIALTLWRLISRIHHLTLRDPLTGTLNRRAFEQALAEAQAQLVRGHSFALVMIDVDHFKRVNDQHGHAAGDAALRHCVNIWQAGLREVDRLGRLGGEEFCALLPLEAPADLTQAAAVAERLRSQLATQPLPWQNVALPLTASFGVARSVAGDVRGEAALMRADAELYRAKSEGRNRVCVAAEAA